MTGASSWERTPAPTRTDRVQILALLLFFALGVLRTAHDFSQVVDQVRLLAGVLPVSVLGARRCSKPQGRVRLPGGGFSLFG